MLAGKGEGQPVRQIFPHPGSQFGCNGGLFGDNYFQACLGREAVGTIEHGADDLGDGGQLIQPRHISMGILPEMKLAALSGDAREKGLACGPKPFVVITDEKPGRTEAALLEAGQERAPMALRFAKGDTYSESAAFLVRADFFVTRVEEHIRFLDVCNG